MLTIREPRRQCATACDRRFGATTVAVGLRMSREQIQALRDALGSGITVEDIRRAARDSEVVLLPPCSPQTIEAVLGYFPEAQVLVVEVSTETAPGPVSLALAGGASAYSTGSAGSNGLAGVIRWLQGAPAV
jgi:hypothetical protein